MANEKGEVVMAFIPDKVIRDGSRGIDKIIEKQKKKTRVKIKLGLLVFLILILELLAKYQDILLK